MGIFKRGFYEWWQVGLLKLALLLIGIAIGATWPTIFVSYAVVFVIVGVVLGLYLGYIWIKQ